MNGHVSCRSKTYAELPRAERTRSLIAEWIANRVPDVSFLLNYLLESHAFEAVPDPAAVGIVGHSFGGWTALAAPDHDRRIRAVVAPAPGGSPDPRPGIIPSTLAFDWGRDVPTLYLVAAEDTSLPLRGMDELFERTPATKLMVVLHRADHLHFVDNVEEAHEAMRHAPVPEEMSWISEMRPIAEPVSGDQAHSFVRGLTLSHLDATLRREEAARGFLGGEIQAELAGHGVDVTVRRGRE